MQSFSLVMRGVLRARLLSSHASSGQQQVTSPLARYEQLVRRGSVSDDARQRSALHELERVWRECEHGKVTRGEELEEQQDGGWTWKWLRRGGHHNHTHHRHHLERDDAPPNVYLYGSVGTGKSFLMDTFYDCLTVAHKRRVHFHAFMLDVHQRIHHWRKHERRADDSDPIPPVARKLRSEARVLCFDEFQVTDVADAMILKRLFEELLNHNVRMVITSNRVPEDLYLGGLNRPLFVPFIEQVLRKRFTVIDLTSEKDYRLVGERAMRSVYLHPSTEASVKQELEHAFRHFLQGENVQHGVFVTSFGSRKLEIPRSGRGVCFFTFDQLIRAPLSASDYLAVAKEFHTVFLSDIPRMQLHENVLARRFITLIDALYEHRCKFICSAEGPPETLFPDETGGGAAEEVFAFKRCVSRLVEMSSKAYLGQAHKK